MKRLFLLLSPLALAACEVEPIPPGPEPLPPADACGAPGLQGLVGQHRSVLNTMRFTVPVRVIPPGTAVTMDYSPTRLNIELDARNRIVRVYCG